jgi:hypothetical protein
MGYKKGVARLVMREEREKGWMGMSVAGEGR